ncbi:MAG: hypothetical protein ACRCXC_12040 [Legionella sp.]
MYNLCDLLIAYHQEDYVRADLQKLKELRQEIEAFYNKEMVKREQKSIHHFSDFLVYGLDSAMSGYFYSFVHVSEFRQMVGTLNTNRSRVTYSRGLANHLMRYLQKSSIDEYIEELNKILVINGVSRREHVF